MTDMDKLIEAIEKLTETQLEYVKIYQEYMNLYQKSNTEMIAHSRFLEGTRFTDAQMGDFIESPTRLKELKKFMKGLSKKVLPFIIVGDWDKALQCYMAGVGKFMEQHKGKGDKGSEAHYG